MSIPRAFIGLVFALLLGLVPACAGRPEDGPEEGQGTSVSIVTPRNLPPESSLGEEEQRKRADMFQGLLDRASMLNVKEDYRGALATIEEALAMSPPEPFGHRFLALEIKVRKDLLRRSYLDAFVRFDRPWYTVGETIEGEIVLMNISDRELVVPASQLVDLPPEARGPDGKKVEESWTMIRSVMTYREFAPSNSIVTNRRTENFRIDEDVRLLPGETFKIPITIESGDINVAATMYRRYRVDCSLHAVSIKVGDEVFHGVVEFKGAFAGVFPRNAEHLADDPMARVLQALEKASPLHASLAAAFIDPDDEKATRSYCELCLRELERPEALERLQDALMTGLAIMEDDDNNRTKDEWITWLKRKTR